jgi:hypothetical protein
MDKISNNPRIQADYEEMLRNDVPPKLAEMLALQQPPACSTDTRFMTGKQGNEYYSPQLASYPGDPSAIVSSRSDVKRVAEQKGMFLEGTFGMSHTPEDWGQAEPDQPYQVADDIVDEAIQDMADEYPEAASDPDLRSDLKKRFSGDVP